MGVRLVGGEGKGGGEGKEGGEGKGGGEGKVGGEGEGFGSLPVFQNLESRPHRRQRG